MSSISYRTFLLRLRKLAERALEAYGLQNAKLKFHTYTGNGIYKVIVKEKSKSFDPGLYTLRLHQPNYMRPEYISSELEWLLALTNAGIKVPEPFRNLQGNWLTKVESEYEVPCERNCSLVRWVEGRMLKNNLKPNHVRALGKVIGKMHEQSIGWKIPKGFTRPHWDWHGLFDYDYGVPGEDARAAIPKRHKQVFNDALELLRETFEQLGKGKKLYGLIHADLGLSDNVLFHAGEARPLDFDDCGFGYWLFDLGVPSAQYYLDVNDTTPTVRNALIDGYRETSPLADLNLKYLDHFMAARYAQFMFFYQASGLHSPQYIDEANQEIDENAKFLKRVLKRINE
jgi:Ser/Thr protein kinase RdoA (MazF antagonist)